MKFCNQCGEKVTWKIPDGDDRPRFICGSCATIHYQNPNMVVGTVPLLDQKILLCRRAIEPSRGQWTLPAGCLENGETVADCAIRETWEEARARIDDLQPYALVNLPFINQVYFLFRARLLNYDFSPGPESLEVKLFSPSDIPWDKLAFSAIHEVLKLYCDDIKTAEFPFRIVDVHPANTR